MIEASTPWSRLLGLAGLDAVDIPFVHALMLRPCRSVHTFGMRFDLDLVFLSSGGRIVKIDWSVPPARICGSLGAAAVLECPARLGPPPFLADSRHYAELLSRPSRRAGRA